MVSKQPATTQNSQHHTNKNFKLFWKTTNRLCPKPSLPVSVAGVHDPAEIAKAFKAHFRVDSPLGPSAEVVDEDVESAVIKIHLNEEAGAEQQVFCGYFVARKLQLMHSNNQHGRQPPPQQTAPPSDPRTRNLPPTTSAVEASSGICRDFIWGICTLGAQCRYRHDLEYEAMKAVLKFCHDHQNRTGCTRPDCTYLHTSREEENLFLTGGTIPRLLYDRYIAMASASGSANATAPVAPASESVQSAPAHNNIYEYIAQPPPPPPPLPSMSQSPRQSVMQSPMQASMQPSMMQLPMLNHMQAPMQGPIQAPNQSQNQGPMQGPMHGPMHGPMQGPMQGPMPVPAPRPTIPSPMLPPPPPPQHCSAVSSMRMSSSAYTEGLPPQQNMTAHYHGAISQQSLPPMFDPTRPPPPIPQPSTSRASKRPAEDCEAGPSKLRKSDSSNDSSCESCVERLIRIELYNQKIEQLQQQTEQARLDITSKMEEYESKKLILKSVVGPEMYRRMLDVVENDPSSPFSQLNEMNMLSGLLSSNTSPNNRNAVAHQLIDMILENNTRGVMEPMPADMSSVHTLVQQLIAWSNSGSGSADLINTLYDLLRNVQATERSTPIENRSSEPNLRLNAAASSNGFNRFMADSAPTAGPSAGRFARPYGDNLGAGPSNAGLPASVAGPAPAPAPIPIRPYLDNAVVPANLHPYAENVPGPSGAPYVESLAGPSARPYADNVAGGSRYHTVQAPPPRQYHPETVPANAPPTAAPPTYMPASYSPAHLPTTRPFYGQGQHGHPPNNMSNPPYPAVVMSQAPRPSMPPQNVQTNPYFMGVRYPNQQYYPPYQ